MCKNMYLGQVEMPNWYRIPLAEKKSMQMLNRWKKKLVKLLKEPRNYSIFLNGWLVTW